MKFLTIRQPWASLIVVGAKTIETRPFSTQYLGPLAIHAGLSPAPHHSVWFEPDGSVHVHECAGRSMILRGHQEPGRTRYEHDPMAWGAVVAVCDLVDVVPIVRECHDGSDEVVVMGVQPSQPNALWHFPTDPAHIDYGGRDLTSQLPFGDFTPGRYAWLLDNVRPIDPVPMRGAQGLRDVPADVLAALTAEEAGR